MASTRTMETARALLHPKPGDEFTEHFAYWMWVVWVEGDLIGYADAIAPCKLPQDAVLHVCTFDQFKKKFFYGKGTEASWLTFIANLQEGFDQWEGNYREVVIDAQSSLLYECQECGQTYHLADLLSTTDQSSEYVCVRCYNQAVSIYQRCSKPMMD